MVALYVTSMEEAAGKSSVCAGLGRILKARGKRVGYMKPVCNGKDADVDFIKTALALKEPSDVLCVVSGKDIAGGESWLEKVQEAYGKVSGSSDVVLLEGVSGIGDGGEAVRTATAIIARLKAKSVLVTYYHAGISGEQVAAAARALGDSLIGVIINGVPEDKVDALKSRVVPAIEKAGIPILGILPEDRSLFAVTVKDLAESIGGRILNDEERAGELVESIMVGALSPDSARSYLDLKDNKAVVTRVDHADIQLAALNSSIRCLVLTEDGEPLPVILSRARERKVPIITVEKDTMGTLEALEKLYDRAQFNHEGKVERIRDIVERYARIENILN